MNIMVICLNLANEDPVHREIFGKLDFRVGLSHAINRAELIKATMQGQGKPYQAAPLPDSPFYDEELATQYLEYDEELANAHLDRAGYTRRSADGARLGPDGKPIVITMDVVPDFQPEWTDMLAHVKRYWHAVGVGLRLKTEDRSLFGERTAANRHDATVWSGAGGRAVLLDARYYFPFNGGSYFGLPWMDWYNSAGESGEKPPTSARRQMKLYDQLRETADPDRQHRIMTEVLGIAKSQFYAIGIARETQKYFIRSDKFRNVPNPLTKSWSYPTPGPTETSQYFIER